MIIMANAQNVVRRDTRELISLFHAKMAFKSQEVSLADLGPGSTVKCLLALSLIQQWCVNLVWSAALAFCLSDLSVHTGIATTV